jgi:hypothetical protein
VLLCTPSILTKHPVPQGLYVTFHPQGKPANLHPKLLLLPLPLAISRLGIPSLFISFSVIITQRSQQVHPFPISEMRTLRPLRCERASESHPSSRGEYSGGGGGALRRQRGTPSFHAYQIERPGLAQLPEGRQASGPRPAPGRGFPVPPHPFQPRKS